MWRMQDKNKPYVARVGVIIFAQAPPLGGPWSSRPWYLFYGHGIHLGFSGGRALLAVDPDWDVIGSGRLKAAPLTSTTMAVSPTTGHIGRPKEPTFSVAGIASH